jgi:hypothetical protein
MEGEAVNQWLDEDHVRILAENLLKPGLGFDQVPNEKVFGTSFEGFADPESPVSSKARQSLSDAQSRASSAGIIAEKNEQTSAPSLPSQPELKPRPEPVAQLPRIPPQPVLTPREPMKPVAPVSEPMKTAAPVKEQVQAQPRPSQPAPAPSPVQNPFEKSPFKIAPVQAQPEANPTFRPLPLSSRLQSFGVWLKQQIPTRAYFICNRHGEIVVDEVGSEKLVNVARSLAHASSSAGRQVGDGENLGSLHVKIGPDRVMEVVPRHSHFGLVVLGIIVPRPLSRDAVASVSRALGTALEEPSVPRQ